MADRKITDLTALAAGSQATGDLLTIVDVSEAAATDKNKKITVESLFKGIPGNVGIGSSSVPRGPLSIYNASAPLIHFWNDTTTSGSGNGTSVYGFQDDFVIQNRETNGTIQFQTANTERLRIDSSGNVGIGVSSVIGRLHVNDSNGAVLTLTRTSGATSGNLGKIRFGNTNVDSALASITAIQDGATNSSALTFGTQVVAGADTERMRIDSSGNVGVGLTPTAKFHVGGTIQSQTGSTVAQMFTDGGAAYFTSVGAYPMLFQTNGSERMRIDSSGRLLIGTTTEGNSVADTLTLAESGNCGITIRSGTSSVGALYYADGTSGNEEFRGYVEYNHSSDYLRIGTAGTERMRILSSGGLTFNGDTAQANALDDYEEGTFTPSLTFDGNNSGMSISNQEGVYTKIGRLVTCFVRITLTSKGSSTGFAAINNLPFVVSNIMTTTAVQGGAHFSFISGFTTTAVALYAQPWESTTTARLYHNVNFASVEVTDESDLANNFDFRLTFSYMT